MVEVNLPDWIEHPIIDDKKRKRQTIFSVHVHPDGSRLATGGLDQKVRIWATEPILNAEVEKQKDANRLLSAMSRHTGSVLCVRWSPSGRFLASGSDDTICLIWELDPTGLGGGTFGSFGSREDEANVESWRPHRRLAGHESDVVDLAWSTDKEDSYLATVGLDSRVMVWSGPRNGPGSFERVRVITGHQGFVKGVVWDPIGRYLATASDDKTMKFWQVGGDWSLQKTVSKPFETSRSTFFRRSSWSPDGVHVLAANAMVSGSVFVANVIDTEDWKSDVSLVGHENAVAVTAFSPQLVYDKGEDGKDCLTTLMALGSLDQSLSIWLAGHRRPICVARDLFQLQVMDLSWSSDGMTLYACSADGYIACVKFTSEDLQVAPESELQKSRDKMGFAEHQRKFRASRSSGQYVNGVNGMSHGTTDRPNMLVPRKAGVPRATITPAIPTPVSSQSSRLTQQITLTRDGKRRIKPTLLNGSQSIDQAYSYGGMSSVDSNLSSSSVVEVDPASFPLRGAKRTASDSYGDQDDLQTPSVKRIKDVGRTLGGNLSREQAGPSTLLRSDVHALLASMGAGKVLPAPAVLSSFKREESVGTIEVRNFEAARPTEIYYFDANSEGRASWMDFSDSAAIAATVSDKFSAIGFEDGSVVVYSPKGRIIANMRIETTCHKMESQKDFLVIITSQGQLRRWDVNTNKEVHRPISISSLYASKVGHLAEDEIAHFWVHSNGIPIIIMRSEKAFALDPERMSWTLISSGWFADCSPVWEGRTRARGASIDANSGTGSTPSSRRDTVRRIESTINDMVIIQRSDTGIQPSVKPPQDRLEEFDVAITLKHLEARLNAAALLDSPSEYKLHLTTYAKKLGDEGIRNQAEELCKSLIGPLYYNPNEQITWKPTVCGLQKREVLVDVLRSMSKGRLLLGLVEQYHKHLKDIQQS